MSGMNSTAKRREVVAFSRSYAEAPNGIGVSLKGPLANLPGKGQRLNIVTEKEEFLKVLEQLKPLLKDKVVGVQAASIQAAFLEEYLKGVVTVQEYKSTEQRDLDLSAGRLDAIVTSLSAMEASFKKPEFKEFGNVGPLLAGGVFGDGVSVGLRKDDTELKVVLDKAINEMLADGTMKTLSEKWFKTDYTPKK
jgi:octopine/nopaline transport system substrate-binding protein